MISEFSIPPSPGTGKGLVGGFLAAIGPLCTPFPLVHPLHHVRIVVNLTALRIVMQLGLTSVIELDKGLRPLDR